MIRDDQMHAEAGVGRMTIAVFGGALSGDVMKFVLYGFQFDNAAFFLSPMSWLLTATIGAAWYGHAQRKGIGTVGAYATAGALIGLLPIAIAATIAPVAILGTAWGLYLTFVYTLAGIASALVAWLALRPGRKSSLPPQSP